MMRALLLLLILAPVVAAGPTLPTGNNDTAPSPSTGNNGSAAGPAESTEGAPGVVYGVLVLVGMVAFVGVLAYVASRYNRDRK